MELGEIRYALNRIQMEYTEMSEMRLTRSQVSRLLGLPIDACEVALASLVQSGFLVRDGDGTFLRGSSSADRSASRAPLARAV